MPEKPDTGPAQTVKVDRAVAMDAKPCCYCGGTGDAGIEEYKRCHYCKGTGTAFALPPRRFHG